MPTITVPRANVTVEDVSTVLRTKLGPRYQVTPGVTSRFYHQTPAGPNSALIRRHWFEQASIQVIAGPGSTEIHVGSAANFTPTALLINRVGIIRKVHRMLEQSPELASR
jgi:hypothetical protein